MNRLSFIHITLYIMAAMTVFSCGGANKGQKEEIGTASDWEEIDGIPARGKMPGDWAPIRLSMDNIAFGPEGGSVTVTCENYGKWWLNDVQITGTEKYIHADPGNNNEYLTLNADGFKAVIIDGNKVKITVSPSKAPGDWLLHLEAGDAFTQIRITKEGL
ncbi:MAG: hypothetical protein IKX03_03865 [Bacteroidales bacterium]|nr:hypothetical protein [Bacteroidales bacterium]